MPFALTAQQKFNFADSAIENRLKKDLYFLSSDSAKGREAGTIYEMKAGNYIANEFKKAGLTPFNINDSSYFQEFSNYNNFWDEENNTLKINETALELWKDFYPLAHAGEGTVNGLAFNKASSKNPESDLKGKILFINEENTVIEEEAKNAESKGASAIIIIPKSEFYSYYNSQINCLCPVFIINKSTYEKINFSENTIVSLQLKKQSGQKMHNVIGCINNRATSTIIIGGHYDHLGFKKDNESGELKIFNGADDNASGTIAVIELARYLKQEGSKNYNYIFCAFSGEEEGLLGSYHFVNSEYFKSIPFSQVKYMLDYDMVGRLGAFGNVLFLNGTGSSKQWKKIIKNNRPENFYINKIPDGMNGSDDYPFYQKGIPVLFFITGLHHEYHTPADDPEKVNIKGEVHIINYSKNLINNISSETKINYHKVNFWQTFRSYYIYAKMLL